LATLPKYMAVLVASTVTKQGSTTAGDVVRIVIVKVDAGAAASASADGTGVVVATLCP
jgi:hypothetical protein